MGGHRLVKNTEINFLYLVRPRHKIMSEYVDQVVPGAVIKNNWHNPTKTDIRVKTVITRFITRLSI